MFDISKYCLPAKIYLTIALIAVIFGAFSEFSAWSVVFHTLLIVGWTVLLNWLCSSGLAVLSWALVLIPYILVLIIFISNDLWFTSNEENHGEENHGE
jgi:hypothetical protein